MSITKKYIIGGLTAFIALGSSAMAGGIVESCYDKRYVAAKVATSQKMLRGESRSWTNLDNGPGLVTRVRHPAVYIQSSRQIAADRYVLVPISCK